MYAQYQKAMQTRLRIMLFNGDVDSVCCYLADEWFVDALHAKERSEYKQWFYQPSNKSKQVGGYYKAFKRFTFATVRGSGHYVPKDRPLASLTMFKMYLDDEFN
ncbi:carboxypeptidase [Plakobranchus ocellatus]|uniref:Carboxypeptidase n=1 Tax=Plakobranchus ocellatus TaxID=259542 RepID=A0AAV4BY22_9GAST|nr:carboxypeptidase [Plakobranchus ocellatus]